MATVQVPCSYKGVNLSFADGHVKWYKSVAGATGLIKSGGIYNGSTGFTSTTPSSGQNPTFNAVLP